jgi:DNA-binding MarR family transcriptional regulator
MGYQLELLNDTEAEYGYITALMVDNDYNENLDDHFFTSWETKLVNKVLNKHRNSKNLMTLADDELLFISEIREDGKLDEIEAFSLWRKLTDIYTPSFHAPLFAARLRRARQRRLLTGLAEKLLNATINDDDTAIERLKTAISEVERRVSDTRASVLSTEFLLTTDFPEPHWAIKDILPAGLAMIAGRPKAGKSWMALQMARDISTGARFLERYHTTVTKTLYIALEDSERRLAGRMKLQNWKETTNAKFMLSEQFYKIGGLRALGGLSEVFGVIFIDTFTRSMDGDQVSPQEMKAILDPLQNAALTNNSVICFIDHMPKRSGRENEHAVIDDVFGSVAKTGVADVIWGLYRDASTPTGVLAGTGRDLMDFKNNLVFESGVWLMADLSARAQHSEARHIVLETIAQAGDISQSDIVEETGMHKGTVSKALDYLESFGLLLSHRSGRRIVWQCSIAGRQILEQWNAQETVARQVLMGENVR